MSLYYIESLKKALTDPKITKEALADVIDEAQFFFGVLRVKIESKDPAMREQAINDLATLKNFLETHVTE